MRPELASIVSELDATTAHAKAIAERAGDLKYHVYLALRVLPVHQRRHLWQADRVLDVFESA